MDFDENIELNTLLESEEKKRMRPLRPRFLIPVLIVLLIAALAVGGLAATGYLPVVKNALGGLFNKNKGDNTSSKISAITTNTGAKIEAVKPDGMRAVFVESFEQDEIDSAVTYCTQNNLNFIAVPAYKDEVSVAENDTLQYAVEAAHKSGVLLCVNVDCTMIPKSKDASGYTYLCEDVRHLLKNSGADAVVISAYGEDTNSLSYADYIRSGNSFDYDSFATKYVSAKVTALRNAVKDVCPTVYLGLLCDPVWASNTRDSRGVAADGALTQALINNHSDTLSFVENGLFDFVLMDGEYSTVDTRLSFETALSWWQAATTGHADLYPLMRASFVGKNLPGWASPDQLTRQMTVVDKLQIKGYAFDSFSALKNDTTGSTEVLLKYLAGTVSTDGILRDLTFTAPNKTALTVTEDHVTFTGASDPAFPLTCNNNSVERTENGYFSVTFNLSKGLNTFTFTHKGKTVVYKVTYRYVVLKSINPSSAVKVNGGSTYAVYAVARTGSTVYATFNGQTVALARAASDSEEEPTGEDSFCGYSGAFTMPTDYSANKTYGGITFKATYNGQTETATSGKVTVLKSARPTVVDNTVYPSNSNYINVGAGLIGEVVNFQAETFNGNTVDDLSQAYNNYLPQGTVDYISPNNVYLGKTEYVLMRCGKRLYTTSKGVQIVKTYAGTLPATNNVSVAATNESSRYTTLTLNVDWRAPFEFQLKNQSYNSDRSIGNVTFSYVSITFNYAGSFAGNIDLDPNNPVFSGYEIIKNEVDYTLILRLRKTAGFYGWYASYNSNGQLVFKFLKPKQISSANNSYGVSLSGARIVVDAGHGGNDGGSPGKPYNEAALCLILANKVKARLESLGATVIMTRTADTTLSPDDRMKKLINAEADFMVSIHRNAASSSKPNGFGAYYFNAFSKSAAQKVFDATKSAGLYANSSWTALKFHYFYMCRCTVCPTVLTENGFMTNSSEYQKLVSDSYNDQCADALTHGIVNYFKSIQ